MYLASMIPLDPKDWKRRHKINKLPVLLVFHQGRLVAQVSKFPLKYRMKDFLYQIAIQSVISNLELEAGKLIFSLNKVKMDSSGIKINFLRKNGTRK